MLVIYIIYPLDHSERIYSPSNLRFIQKPNKFKSVPITTIRYITNKNMRKSKLHQPTAFTSIDAANDLYNEVLTTLMDKHCPVKKKQIKPRDHAWFDESLYASRRTRRRAERKWRKSGDRDDRRKYINLRNQFDKTEYVKKSNHHRKELKKCGSDSKKLFQKIKTLTGKNVKHLPTNEDSV